jgi:hypothetical protein
MTVFSKRTPCPYPNRSNVWASKKTLITEEIWPGLGLNPGLPNDMPALYPLLHEVMLKNLAPFNDPRAQFFKNQLRRSSKIQLIWIIKLLKHFYIVRK